MLTLCLDTAYKYLSLALIEDDQLIAAIDEPCFKRQSELVFVRMGELFKQAKKQPLDIDAICITKGPGSYTGVRIAMSIAKTIAEVKGITLYTISTLKLYAGNQADTAVILDARAERIYYGRYNYSEVLIPDQILSLKDFKDDALHSIGDLTLIGQKEKMPLISACFLKTKDSWEKVDNVAYLTPLYLKESSAYQK